MADKLAIMLELERRGKLPPDKLALLTEARKRGLVGGAPQQQAAPQSDTPPVGAVPGSREYADWAARRAMALRKTDQTVPMVGPHAAPTMVRPIQQPQAVQPDVTNNPQNSALPGFLGQMSNTIRSSTQGLQDSATLNLGDEMAAGVKTGIDAMTGQPADYGKTLQQAERLSADTANLNPSAYGFGQTAGTLALLGRAPSRAIMSAVPAVLAKGTIKRAALSSGTIGATMGFGEPGSIQDRLKNAAIGGATGLLTGAAGGYVAGRLAAPTAGKAATPTVEKLFDEASGAFRAARASGATVSKPAVSNIAAGLRQIMVDEGAITPSGKVADLPKISHALALIDDYATQPVSMEQLFRVRKQLGKAAASTDKEERGLAMDLLRHLDDSVESLSTQAGDFVAGGAGSGEQAVADWVKGRQLWHIAKKGESVETLISTAARKSKKAVAVPPEQSLRNQFENFISKDRNLRGFNPEERAALNSVVEGTTTGNLAKSVGKLAPTTIGGLTFKGGVPLAVGAALGSPGLGVAVAGGSYAIGLAGRLVSRLSTQGQAELARVLILNGGKLPTKVPSNLSGPVKKTLGNLIMVGGANSANLGQQITHMLAGPQATGAVTQ